MQKLSIGIAAGAAALTIAACGGSPHAQAGTTSPIPSPSETASVMPASSEAPPSAATAASAARTAVPTNIVTISGMAFHPEAIKVKPGETVTWTNDDPEVHTIKIGGIVSPAIQKGQTYKYTFHSPGTYTYICSLHPNMHGTVIVSSA